MFLTHKFELISEASISEKLHQLLTTSNDIVKKGVHRILQAGIITPVESAWNSAIVSAMKKGCSPRFCINFRRLNAVMKSDKWPMQCFEEMFDNVRGSKVFTELDLFKDTGKSKFWSAISNFKLLNRYSNKNIVRIPCQNCKLNNYLRIPKPSLNFEVIERGVEQVANSK